MRSEEELATGDIAAERRTAGRPPAYIHLRPDGRTSLLHPLDVARTLGSKDQRTAVYTAPGALFTLAKDYLYPFASDANVPRDSI